ncbi:MAG TPA: adenosylcobinamide-GDP ribazoletransferase [Thermohalobaculum sp.]|nr:adenosylcobinamide-GDP ribazoletransferase [Thermohalobaculum sp.]
MNRVRNELVLLLSAAGFLTRMPVPGWIGWAEDRIVRASRYFAVIGALIGAFGGLVWWLAGMVFPPVLAAGLALGAIVLLTGAMHEDGLADCADGFGGGKTGAQALEIMRDSQIGSYGALALVFSVGLRWAALSSLTPVSGVIALMMAGGISRAMMVPATAMATYARPEGLGSGFAAGARNGEVVVAMGTALALGILGGWAGMVALALAMVVSDVFLNYMTRRIGGYTGDGLGMMAQLGEIAVLVSLALTWA